MRIRLLQTCLLLAFCLFGNHFILAQTTYIGPDNGIWLEAANWSNGLPAPGNKATIPGNGFTVRIASPLTFDFDVDNFSNITAEATLTNEGVFQSLGNFTINNNAGLINSGTFNNFQSTIFEGNGTFENRAGGNFINGGMFTLPTVLNNQGDVTNNGTILADQGLVQTNGTFSNNQIMTVTSLTVTSGSSLVNNFGATLNVSGTGTMFDADGNITNNGTITSEGPATVRGTFQNNVTFNVGASGSLTITAAGQFSNGGTVLNQGSFANDGNFINSNNFYNEGQASNNGTFSQNNRLENRAGASFTNTSAATMSMGFGAVILNEATFINQNEISSVGRLTNNGTFTNTGNYVNNSGGVVDNQDLFTNDGSFTSFFTVTNDDRFINNAQLIVGSGCIFTNNLTFTNSTSGNVLNQFEIVNNTGGTYTNLGTLNNTVRMFVEGGTVINQAFFKNTGDIFTKTSGTLRNDGFLLQETGNIKNEGTLDNNSELLSDDCSTINNIGTIDNAGDLRLRGIIFQRGTLSGTALNIEGGYVHTDPTSNAPAVCANETITADADGIVKAYATSLIAFANFDSCQNIIYSANGIARPTFTCNEIGTVQDINIRLVTRLGDSLTCIAQVTPADQLAPNFTLCPTDITVETNTDNAVVSWALPTATDNCDGDLTLTSTANSGASFPIGITAVTYSAEDDYANTQECQFKVNVIKTSGTSNCTGDTDGPVLNNCPADFVVSSSQFATPVSWTPPTATDACGPISLSSNFSPGRFFPLGRDTVEYTATDGNGNSSSCSFIVNVFANDLCVTDNQNPTFSNCPATVFAEANPSLNGALVFWTAPNVSDNCGIAQNAVSHPNPSVFPIGSTTVTYTAADPAGNTAICSFEVSVGNDPCPGDNSAPVISACPADVAVNIASGIEGTATWTAPTAADPCSSVTLTSNYAPGAIFPVGNTQVIYTASDAKGNSASCTFTVSIKTPCSSDNAGPTITACPDDIIVATTASSAAVTWTAPVASDVCGISSFGASYASGADFPVGVTSVVYTAFDLSGNSSNCAFNIEVVNAPDCAPNAQPIDNATNVNENGVSLSWNASAGANSYDVYLGLSANDTKLVAPNVVGTSVDLSDLNGGTTYFWYIEAKNDAGTASGCNSTTSFTTAGTPQTGPGGYGIDNNMSICRGEAGTGLTHQIWNNIPNTTISDLTSNANYPDNPSSTTLIARSKSTWGQTDNYGTRVRGFITPDISGTYQFVITGDDQTRLYLSQSENPAAMAEVARIDGWTGQNQFTKYASQTSANITLTAGQSYYIELLHKEGGGGDGWGIHWTAPGSSNIVEVPSSMLSPLTNDCVDGRVTDDLVALYDFKEGSGNIVRDVSGVGAAMDLTISHPGRVTRLNGSCGLRINSGTIIKRIGSSSKMTNMVSASNELTIEAWVKPTNLTQAGPARIATFSSNTTNRNFTLGQEAVQYNIRLKTSTTSGSNGFPEVLVNGVATRLQHVVYTRNTAGVERLYIDNELHSTTTRTGTLSFDNSFSFALGNELTENRAWLGEYALVAVYSKALSEAEIGQNYHKGVCSDTDINVCDGNMSANGTFENDFFGWGNSGGAITSTSASGTKAAEICGNGSVVSELAIAQPGKTYTLTAQARISGSPPYAVVSIYFLDINNSMLGGYNDVVVNSSTYQTYTESVVAPANTAWVRIEGFVQGTSGCLLMDDMCLTDGTQFMSGGGSNGGGTTSCTGDTEAPIFAACPSNQTLNTTTTNTTATWTPPSTNDNCANPLVASNHNSGDVFELGTTTVQYTAMDTQGNTGTCDFTVTVNNACANDTQAPSIANCPSNIVLSTAQVTTPVTWIAPSANDICGPVTLTSTHLPGDFFAPGLTQVVYTAVDGSGNLTTCDFTVTVNSTNECANDTTAPIIDGCPSGMSVVTSGTGQQVNWPSPIVNDNCGAPQFTSNFIPGLIFPIGVTTVVYQALDVSGNLTVCSFDITVTQDPCATDIQAPTLTACPSNIVQQINGTSEIITWTEPTAADNCSAPTMVASNQSGASFGLGTTTVTYTATDAAGNTTECSFDIVLTQTDPCTNDTEVPVLSGCPADITMTTTGTTTSVTWPAITATDNCPNVMVTSTADAGDVFQLGNTVVTYTATDPSGNSATCDFTVTVEQIVVGPDCAAITLSGDNGVLTLGNLNAPVVAIQVFDSQFLTAFSCAGNCNTPTQVINGLAAGAYYVKVDFYTASWQQICQREEFVTVSMGSGTGVLTFDAPADITMDAAPGANSVVVNYPAPAASSTCPNGTVAVLRTAGPASGSDFAVGTTEVCYEASDACGNVQEVCFNVTVNSTGNGGCDDVTFTVGANNLTVGGLNTPISLIQVFNSQWLTVFNCAGNCDQPSTTITDLPAGTYFVKVDLLDASWGAICSKEQFFSITGGNSSVIVLDQPADMTILADEGASSALVIFDDPSATSTCATNNLVITQTSGPSSGAAFPIGTTEVCYQATDDCGNLENVCFSISVEATTGSGTNCNTITFAAGQGSIIVDNLIAPVVTIQLFDASYTSVINCFGNCATPTHTFSGLAAGTYFVKVDYFDASWQPICQRNETIEVVNAAIFQQENLSFIATKEGTTARLKWVSNSTKDVDKYEVERSANGLDFKLLLTMPATQDGNAIQYYEDLDIDPMAGANYYRLRQSLANGATVVSEAYRLDFANDDVVSIYPNPAMYKTFINLKPYAGKVVSVKVQNVNGRLMQSYSVDAISEGFEMDIADYESGLYFIEIQAEGHRKQVLKLVKTR